MPFQGQPDMAKSNNPAEGSDHVEDFSDRTAHDQVFDWFDSYVEDNGLKVGDDLPTEEEIMKSTGISRSTVREAITRLRALGIVESKRKRGMRLMRSPALLDLIRLLSAAHISKNDMGHVGGVRCALELGFCSEIYRRATNEDIIQLRQIFNEMVASSEDPAAWNACDRRFHEKLIGITGNKMAIWLSQMLVPFFDTLVMHLTPLPDHVRSLHESIVVALEQRDYDAFYDSIFEHNYYKLPHDLYVWSRSRTPAKPTI